jgi:hypothetical protein
MEKPRHIYQNDSQNTVITPNAGEDTDILDYSYVVSGNVNWYSHSRK